MWPDVQAAGPWAVGTYVALGIWANSYGYEEELPRLLLRAYGSARVAAQQLVRVGLWTETAGGYKPVTLTQLQARRGYRGTTMLVSRLVPTSPTGIHAGIAAFGAWSLAASWSLTTLDPGFIPREAVKRLGITNYVPALCLRDFRGSSLWERVPGGYWMPQGDHPLETRWTVPPNDVRAEIAPDLRRIVYSRDGYKCMRCGCTDDLALDHIYPWSLGGPDTTDNLQTLCRSCNSAKSAHREAPGIMRGRKGARV